MKCQRGNILFLILLAVVLFAALSYAVTQSTRGGGKDAAAEKVATVSAQIVQYGTMLENTVQRMMLSGGCAETQLSFDSGATVTAPYINNSAPSDKHCHAFNPAGGGMYYLQPSTEWLDNAASIYSPSFGNSVISSQSRVSGAGLDTAGVGEDLVLVVPYLKKDICEAINSKLGNQTTIYQKLIAYDLDTTNSWWHGTYGSAQSLLLYANDTATQLLPLPHPRAGCFLSVAGGTRPPSGYYYYYHVLLGR